MKQAWTNLGFAAGLLCLIVGAFQVSRAIGCMTAGVILITMSVVHYKDGRPPRRWDGD